MSKTKADYEPTIDDFISLDLLGSLKINPNGSKIAYTTYRPNWNKNQYEKICYIHDKKQAYQLTKGSNTISQVEWVDDNSLVVTKASLSGSISKNQMYLYENLIGDGLQITDHKKGIHFFRLFAGGAVFKANDPKRSDNKKRKEKFGSYIHFEQEESSAALYYINFKKTKEYLEKSRSLTKDEAKKLVKPIIEISKLFPDPFSVSNVIPSPKGDMLYINYRLKDDLVYATENYVMQIKINPDKALDAYLKKEQAKKEKKKETKDEEEEEKENNNNNNNDDKKEKKEDYSYLGKLTKLGLPLGAQVIQVSPDGSKLLISYKERDQQFYTQADGFVLDVIKHKSKLKEKDLGSLLEKVTGKIDRVISRTIWKGEEIIMSYADYTKSKIVSVKENGDFSELETNGLKALFNFDLSKNGYFGLIGGNESNFDEIYISDKPITEKDWQLVKLTNYSEKIENWSLGKSETITWKSKDGTEINGVLTKPKDYDSKKKYPLVFIVHGGPSWYSEARLLTGLHRYFYSKHQFANKGVLIVEPNYRGSIGAGQAYLELNKDNLGVGDLWDLESCIDHLDNLGMIDTEKVGSMGWSQGGYISAFVGIHSKRFKAVSVGAGIADWYTYHISNDIPQFTTHYLSGSPFRDRTLYEKTSPISKIKDAQTPMLIQHGDLDHRVPLANAKELYRGLKEMNVHVELFIFQGMAHPITKPLENRAVVYQNLNWFSHYLLGEKLDLLQKEEDEDKKKK
ncbi:MAG: alpha/beta hydrolase family protein [Candidatus Heimdallarchaeota archaeon]